MAARRAWGGLGHDFKVGVNFINEPRLFLTFTEGTSDYAYAHADNTLNGPLTRGDASTAVSPRPTCR